MSIAATLWGKTLDEEAVDERKLWLRNGYATLICCISLWQRPAHAWVEQWNLKPLAGIAPEDCYPYPGANESCADSWFPPLETAAAAERYAAFLRSATPEQRETIRQAIFEWHLEREPPLDDQQLEKMISSMISAMEDLARLAHSFHEAGEELLCVGMC